MHCEDIVWHFRQWMTGGLVFLAALYAPQARAQTSNGTPGQMPGMPMGGHQMAMSSGPLGLGDARDGSGTSWLPDTSVTHAGMRQAGAWMLMLHGNAFLEAIASGGSRGDHQVGSVNWAMLMARRDLAGGQFTARMMVSLEPLTVGRCGYPNLLQTGELCRGQALHDAQHPHDLFMEVAVDYRHALGDRLAFEAYGGPSGEPALGPAAFAHRASAAYIAGAPITHHWLDSTHISFGVVTGALYGRRWKAEASAFNGREPDDRRYDMDLAALDSYSGRVSVMPAPGLVVQFSGGHLHAAEQHPDGTRGDVDRLTASAIYHRVVDNRVWATTVAWGRNREGGVATSGFLVETSQDFTHTDTWTARAEVVGKTAADLSLPLPDDHVFRIGKVQAGYTRWFVEGHGARLGFGGTAGWGFVPATLTTSYGGRSPIEGTLFLTVRPK